MKIFGSKAAQVGKKKLPDITCAYCNSKGSVDLYIFYRYYHFLRIPMFPHRRGGAIMCSNCKHVTNAKLFSIDLKETYLQEKNNYKAPWWHYIGSVFLSVLVVSFLAVRLFTYGTISVNKFLAGIKPNNIYKYSLSNKSYTFWKISRVNKDSVYYLPSNYQFSGTPPKEIDFSSKGFFDSAERLYLKSEFKTDVEANKIQKYK
ncbi:MAG: hypothetical protein EKK37_16665 [Sphingobacteriales bacterium]|nr:MAG: hypothetical protein EKK37_16665 [Sphingobacteriales bacterium]